MKAYYFSCKGMALAAVYAHTFDSACELLPVQHAWCNATVANSHLLSVKEGTEWDRICAHVCS